MILFVQVAETDYVQELIVGLLIVTLNLVFAQNAMGQVLALDASGPEHLAQDFGRLMSDIIKNEAEPLPGTFAVQDLAWLLEIEERWANCQKRNLRNVL